MGFGKFQCLDLRPRPNSVENFTEHYLSPFYRDGGGGRYYSSYSGSCKICSSPESGHLSLLLEW